MSLEQIGGMENANICCCCKLWRAMEFLPVRPPDFPALLLACFRGSSLKK